MCSTFEYQDEDHFYSLIDRGKIVVDKLNANGTISK
jgi:hypothetical protein